NRLEHSLHRLSHVAVNEEMNIERRTFQFIGETGRPLPHSTCESSFPPLDNFLLSCIFLAPLSIPFLNHLLKDRSSLTQASFLKLATLKKVRGQEPGVRSQIENSKLKIQNSGLNDHRTYRKTQPPEEVRHVSFCSLRR